MFQYEFGTRLPEVENKSRKCKHDKEIRVKDKKKKQSMKEYADRKSVKRNIKIGDNVVIKQKVTRKSDSYYKTRTL